MNTANGQLAIAALKTGRIDLYAATISTLCLIHCLALPLLAAVLPLAGQISDNELLHKGLVLLAAPATLWVVRHAWRTPGMRGFVAIATTGLGLLVLAAFAAPLEAFELPLTVLGSVLLASAHVWRWSTTRHKREPENDRPNATIDN
ncbi:MAG: MerC domain-containing protein [Pseudomonadota bacterium]